MTATIRTADFDDAIDREGIVGVLDTYARDPAGGGEPLSEAVRANLVPGLREMPNALVLLAFDDAEPVGVAVCFFGFSTFQARPLLNVHDLAVVPSHRGRGVGRALLAEAQAHAVRRDCCRLTLEVQEDNGRARRLYEKFGFVDLVFGESAPTRFLVKPLDPGRHRAPGAPDSP